MEFTVAYKPTVDELETAFGLRGKQLLFRWLPVVVLVLVGVSWFIGPGATNTWVGVVCLGLGVIRGIGIVTLKVNTVKRLAVDTTLTVGPDNYSYQVPSGSGEVRWDRAKLIAKPDCWIIGLGRKISIVIPKRVLSAANEAVLTQLLSDANRATDADEVRGVFTPRDN